MRDDIDDGQLTGGAAATTTLGTPAGPVFATPPPALEFTPENVPCLRVCRHYFTTTDHFDAQNSGKRFVESHHLCTAVPGVELDFSADEPPYECNRWDPLQAHEIGPLEFRRQQYYREHPDHVPKPLEERLMVDIDEPENEPGDTVAAREYLELCRLGQGAEGLPLELVVKCQALWDYFDDIQKDFVTAELEAEDLLLRPWLERKDDDGDSRCDHGDRVRECEPQEGADDRQQAGVREEPLPADGSPGGDGEGTG